MLIVKANEKGILAGEDVTKRLNALFAELKEIEGEKTLVFEKGEYVLSSENCPSGKFYITNTIGEKEWKEGEIPHLIKIGLYLDGIKDLKIEGNGAVFVIDGQMTNMVLSMCENIEVSDIIFKTINPHLHVFEVQKKKALYVDFKLDNESVYKNTNKKKIGKATAENIQSVGKKRGSGFSFVCKDYAADFFKNRITAHWIGKINAESNSSLKRVGHPFRAAARLKEIGEGVFRAYYPFGVGLSFGAKPKAGDKFCIYDARRKNVGIFLDSCKDITLKDISQQFNHSLALVAQDCENVTVDSVRFAPAEGSEKMIASLADFMQFCMCKGDIRVVNSHFEGAGDDCLNVHGIHFKVVKMSDKSLVVRYMHPQTYGFNPLHAGDEIEYIDPNTLLTIGMARVEKSTMLNEYEIEVVVDSTDGAKTGCVIEDVTRCPNLVFSGNTLTRIITRGLLVTTRGKVLIENNKFLDTSMHSILFSNDAKSWFESGRVLDVTIRGNVFSRCPQKNVCIKPENGRNKQAVHGKFLIENNVFASSPGGGIFVKAAEEVKVENNTVC